MKLPFGAPSATGRPLITLRPYIARAIVYTIKAGWTVALRSADMTAGAGEVVMTERLRDGMEEALRSGKVKKWGKAMIVLPGTESRSRPDVLLPDGRTDIPILLIEIFLRFGEHKPHAILECKRIAGNDADLCREYVVEGIDRFQSGKYGANHSTGFMVGYLIGGTATVAARGVNRYLNSGRTSRGRRPTESLRSSSLVGGSWAWQSRHSRLVRSAIDLHHVFLRTVVVGGTQARGRTIAGPGAERGSQPARGAPEQRFEFAACPRRKERHLWSSKDRSAEPPPVGRLSPPEATLSSGHPGRLSPGPRAWPPPEKRPHERSRRPRFNPPKDRP